jgi:hypothetical protein
MTAIIPARTYALARAARVPTLVICADGRFTRLEGAPCEAYAAALAASWRLRPFVQATFSVTRQATRPAKGSRTFENVRGTAIAPLPGHTRRVDSTARQERTAMHLKGALLALAVAALAALATLPATAGELSTGSTAP